MQQPTNCLNVFDQFLKLELKRLRKSSLCAILSELPKTIGDETWRVYHQHEKGVLRRWLHYTLFFISHAFLTQPQYCLIFSQIEVQMLLRCFLIHKTIIILRRNLYLVYLCPCLGLGLFMSYLCNLFFIFSLTLLSLII